MASPSFFLREFFHLCFLRLLSLRLAGRAYALKGGICLRFFHASPRLSEDMDLDAVPNIRPETLAKGVDAVLASDSLLGHLAPRGVSRLTITKPKQTGITQRWKVALEIPGGPVGTKIEFSRRKDNIPAVAGAPSPEILLAHGIAPFAARFYDGPEMVRQKLRALAAPNRNAVRDLYDLHHLLHFRRIPVQTLEGLDPGMLSAAVEKSAAYSFDEFRAQVLPYLTEELIGAYRDAASFARLQDQVLDAIRKALP